MLHEDKVALVVEAIDHMGYEPNTKVYVANQIIRNDQAYFSEGRLVDPGEPWEPIAKQYAPVFIDFQSQEQREEKEPEKPKPEEAPKPQTWEERQAAYRERHNRRDAPTRALDRQQAPRESTWKLDDQSNFGERLSTYKSRLGNR